MDTYHTHSLLMMIALIITLALASATACAGNDEQYFDDRDRAERSTGDFDPGYFRDDELRHIVVLVEVVDGSYRLAAQAAQVRPGKMPHRPKRSDAPYQVSYFADGKEIGSYSGRDPFVVDSYDPDHGPKEGVVTPLKNGIVEILLPYRPIQTLKIQRDDKEPLEFDVTEKVIKLIQQDEEDLR